MDASELQSRLNSAFATGTKHQRRHYLGMSGIGRCPREQYWSVVKPDPADPRLLWYSWTGYMHEAAVLELLQVSQHRRTVVAEFDSRFRGHTDHETDDRTLVDVKSVNWTKLLRIRANGPALENVAQMQAYMNHGDYPHGVLLYVARDVPHDEFYRYEPWRPPFWCVDVSRDLALMEQLDEKAKRILEAIDKQFPPACECRWCRR